MKVIFLDIDGVVNSLDNMWAAGRIEYHNGPFDRDKYGHIFDERCVRWLRLILQETKSQIVISSSWKDSGLKVMQAMWSITLTLNLKMALQDSSQRTKKTRTNSCLILK